MTNRTQTSMPFARSRGRKVEASFSGGHITSDGGLLLVRQAERQLGIVRRIARSLPDDRRRRSVLHDLPSMLKQRIFALACGYEDQNDHDQLRHDLALQAMVGKSAPLAHSSTLCRLENRSDRSWAWAFHKALFETFVARHPRPPKELILDFDATDDLVHGLQEGRFFHGYYGNYCFLPLYVFCGDFPLVAYLRPANIDGARHFGAILRLLVRALRDRWPDVRIIVRGDGGFCRKRVLRWCEHECVDYVIGLPRNAVLERMAEPWLDDVQARSEATGSSERRYEEVRYAAKSWLYDRRVIVKAEYLPGRSSKRNPRFVVTNRDEPPEVLYRELYCARGEMENRIKEQQLDLYADRTSAHKWWPNQLRLLLSTVAYVLLNHIREVGLKGTKLARAYVGTIRLRLIKIGAVIVENTRRVRFLLSSSNPDQELFWLAARKLAG